MPFIGVAPAIKPWRISAGVSVGNLLQHQGRHGRGVGRRRRGAEEARQVLRQVGAGRRLAGERRVAGVDDLAGREERRIAAVRGRDRGVLDQRSGVLERHAVDVENLECRAVRAEWLVGQRVLAQIRERRPPGSGADADRGRRRRSARTSRDNTSRRRCRTAWLTIRFTFSLSLTNSTWPGFGPDTTWIAM